MMTVEGFCLDSVALRGGSRPAKEGRRFFRSVSFVMLNGAVSKCLIESRIEPIRGKEILDPDWSLS